MSIASTPYRLADAAVLIGVMQTPQGPQPLITEIDGHSTVAAYTDVDEARADLDAAHRKSPEVLIEIPHLGRV